tara:strand:+ start:99 stop:599 length:501 start_codon:yes stop_codon:yes gene_type:complete
MVNFIDNSDLRWKHFVGSEKFDYPIDYWAALLYARDDGHVDLLYRWAPNSYCHFHRHTSYTNSTVLSGELHVVDVDLATGEETNPRVRMPGGYVCREPGDVHMERGEPGGAVVLFNIFAPDGLLAETLARDGTVIGLSSLDDILKGKSSRSATGLGEVIESAYVGT